MHISSWKECVAHDYAINCAKQSSMRKSERAGKREREKRHSNMNLNLNSLHCIAFFRTYSRIRTLPMNLFFHFVAFFSVSPPPRHHSLARTHTHTHTHSLTHQNKVWINALVDPKRLLYTRKKIALRATFKLDVNAHCRYWWCILLLIHVCERAREVHRWSSMDKLFKLFRLSS
jgi:hypothetical protein